MPLLLVAVASLLATSVGTTAQEACDPAHLHLDDMCGLIRCTWNVQTTGRTSNTPLVVLAGLGTTSVSSVARLISKVKNVEVYYHKDHLIYNGTSSTLPWQSPEGKKRLSKWVTTYHRLMSLLPHERDAFDFRSVLEEFGVVAGTPIPEYFPYIMRAFPKAKVILTWRDAADWRTHRTAKYPQSPFPFQYMTDSVDNWDQEALKKNRRHTLGTLMTSENKAGSELMMHMHNVLVECLTPADQLLMINPLEESQKEIEKKLARFLGSP